MSLSQPSPPNPYTTAAAQENENIQTAIAQARMNDVNQTTPYGTLTYNQTGSTNINGNNVPTYNATTAYTPQVANLFNTMIGTQQGLGSAANALISNLGPSLSKPPNLGNSALVNQEMQWANQYMQPIFNQQQSNLNSQLASQGITQGSDAWNNAQNLQSRNVNNAYENFLMQAEPTAFNQAVTSYQLPIMTLGTLLGESQPGSVGSSLTSTPQESIQPANLQSLVEQNYGQQLNQYQNEMSGLFGIGSGVLGGLARIVPFSDERVKENVTQVGRLDNGLPIYLFNYKFDPDGVPQLGLIAQDVELVHPEAVHKDKAGLRHVDYEKATR